MADVHILAQAMINGAPEGHKKLICFADSRQDAAFQAGWMQDHARRIRLRHMMHQVIADSGQPLPLDAITDRLMELFRKDKSLIDSLLPELTGEEAAATFGQNKWVPVHKALRYMVLAGIHDRRSTQRLLGVDGAGPGGLRRHQYRQQGAA